ncbi:MAG: ribosomal-processing cysteine protease Prp [Lachnospiraceae bacterium]|nr:ribosomal-processing cysteine protease Prp [Lachnospiraceae bacterium]MDD7048497.1 ribosomal-processing cysteine protease Prp [Lachnospiraceae bacterium]
MTKVTFFQTEKGIPVGFDIYDHAGYEDAGSDIVCAAISALTATTVNALERLTEDSVQVEQDEENARVSVRISSDHSEKADVLLRSLAQGLSDLEAVESYRDFIDLVFEEV